MLRASDFSTASVQLAAFTPEPSEFSASNVLAAVLGKYANLYDGVVQALPLPENAPLEIPRVILQSKNGAFRLEAAPLRIACYWIVDDSLETEPGKGFLTCLDVLEQYLKSTNIQVYRLALVLNRIYKNQNPASQIVEQFCKPGLQASLFKESKKFELHDHKEAQLQSFSVNSWVRFKSAQLVSENSVEPVLLIEQDTNTLAEETWQRFTANQISEYFHLALENSEKTLQNYLPNE